MERDVVIECSSYFASSSSCFASVTSWPFAEHFDHPAECLAVSSLKPSSVTSREVVVIARPECCSRLEPGN